MWCILYHYFDDHRYCTSDFCHKKREQAETINSTVETPMTPVTQNNVSHAISSSADPARTNPVLSRLHALRSSPGYYRSMEKDKKLFLQLKEALDKHFTRDAVKELMHGHNTQTNEGLNTSMFMSAPKFKNFSRSSELQSRAALIAGCHNLGKKGFIERVVEKLNISPKPMAFLDLLSDEDSAKTKRKRKQSTVQVKSRRVRRRVSKALESRRKDIQAFRNGTTYGETGTNSPRKKNPSTCPFSDYGCNTPGHTHKTISSCQCKYHYLWKKNRESDNPEKITKVGWISMVKAVWENEKREEITRNQVTVGDVVNVEFGGNFELLNSTNGTEQPSSSTSCDSNKDGAAFGYNDICHVITQDDQVNSQSNFSQMDMCDIQFSQYSMEESSADESDENDGQFENIKGDEHNTDSDDDDLDNSSESSESDDDHV